MKLNTLTCALGSLVLGTAMTQGAISFVSVASDLSNISPSASVTTTDSKLDNLWRQRNGFGEGDITVLEGWDVDENVGVLTMTLTGLSAGQTYDIYANYIRFGAGADADGNRGGISGSLNGTDFTVFNDAGGTAGDVGYAELTGHADTDRVGMRGYLGTAVANGAGEVVLYIDDDGLDGSIQERVWFDGASYELAAVPEPTSAALIGMAGLAFVLRRRR